MTFSVARHSIQRFFFCFSHCILPHVHNSYCLLGALSGSFEAVYFDDDEIRAKTSAGTATPGLSKLLACSPTGLGASTQFLGHTLTHTGMLLLVVVDQFLTVFGFHILQLTGQYVNRGFVGSFASTHFCFSERTSLTIYFGYWFLFAFCKSYVLSHCGVRKCVPLYCFSQSIMCTLCS